MAFTALQHATVDFVAHWNNRPGNALEAFEQAIKDRATELHQRDWLNADTPDDETETF